MSYHLSGNIIFHCHALVPYMFHKIAEHCNLLSTESVKKSLVCFQGITMLTIPIVILIPFSMKYLACIDFNGLKPVSLKAQSTNWTPLCTPTGSGTQPLYMSSYSILSSLICSLQVLRMISRQQWTMSAGSTWQLKSKTQKSMKAGSLPRSLLLLA